MRCRAAHKRAAQTRTTMSPKTNSGLPAFGSGSAFRFSHALVAFALWLTVICFAPLARAVTFTGNVTISEGDTTYDGQDIIVDGATATINGAHSFTSLSLINGAVLTHSPCTAAVTHKLVLTVTNQITVSTDSRIDVSGKGYVFGRTSGNTTVGAATGHAGGSHGGLSPTGNFGQANAVYGDYADPNDWGAGGGPGDIGGGQGGGLARIHAGTLVLDGPLLANGVNTHNVCGAGGGIYAELGSLSGSGRIEASGATAGVVGGGGGRIAIYAPDTGGFNLGAIKAPGGLSSFAPNGGAGTVHIVHGQSHTHVRSFQPAGINGGLVGNELPTITNRTGYIGNALDRVTLAFNNVIRIDPSTTANFEITGPLGRVTVSGLAELADRTYQVSFPLQTTNGLYHFTVLPTLVDSEGFQLDQNANGIPGEADDGYSFTLILDTVPPRLTQHAPAGDVAGTISSVDVWLSETIDKPKFTTADISILNPGNGSISVSSITEVGLNRFRVSFAPQTAPGTYHVRIGPNVSDLAGNLLDQDRDGIAGESVDDVYDALFNLVPVDLQLSDVTPSANQFVAGDSYNVSWQGRNTTGARLIGNWIDAVYLSPDPFWNITDTLLATVQRV